MDLFAVNVPDSSSKWYYCGTTVVGIFLFDSLPPRYYRTALFVLRLLYLYVSAGHESTVLYLLS